MSIERADAAPGLVACFPAAHAGIAVDLSTDQVPYRVTAECVARQQDHVDEHDERADADPELMRPRRHRAVRKNAANRPASGLHDVVRQNEDKNHRGVHREAMQVLQNEGKPGLAVVVVAWLADGTGDWVEEERAVVRLAVVVARRPEREREDEDQKRGRQRPPVRLDQRRIKRREVGAPLEVVADPCRPGRVEAEAAEDQGRQPGSNPPGVAAHGCAEAAFLQVADRSRHRVTAAIVCLTPMAYFLRAAFTAAVSSSAMAPKGPSLPSFQGTPQYIIEVEL